MIAVPRVPRTVRLEVLEEREVVLHGLRGDDRARLLRRPERKVVAALPHLPVREVVRHGAALEEILPGAKGRARGERGERGGGETPLRVRHREVLGAEGVQEGRAPAALADLLQQRVLEEDAAERRTRESGHVMPHDLGRVHPGQDGGLSRGALGEPGHAQRGVDAPRPRGGTHARHGRA